MAETRTFKVSADVKVWKTVYYIVTAESFEEAAENVHNGYYDDIWDEDENDYEIESVDRVECYECDQDEDDCECESANSDSVFAELGL
jgi:hypothetical protein